MSALSDNHFHNEEAAYAFVEARIWPHGPRCPRCGETGRVGRLAGRSTRIGTYKCYACRKPFTVKVGTVFESSHVPLRKWLQAIFLMASSKKGISSNQLHRTLGVSLKTAWFMAHRIREAMRSGDLDPFGGNGAVVEADETYYGKRAIPHVSPQRKGRPYIKKGKASNNRPILSLVERSGAVRSFYVPDATKANVQAIVTANVARETRLHTDESKLYGGIGLAHETVRHSDGEYVRGDVHTNSVEGFFSIFKRGMRGVYQHCAEQHLHRYLAEFDFRYTHRVAKGVDDATRADQVLKGIVGKRLTYQTTR